MAAIGRDEAHIRLDAFVVMPNHFHAIVLMMDNSPARPAKEGACNAPLRRGGGTLGAFIGGFKGATTRRANALRSGTTPLWQRNYYEHIIRTDRDLDNIRGYVAANPARWREDSCNPLYGGRSS